MVKMHSELFLFNHIMAQEKSNFIQIFILFLDQLFSVTLKFLAVFLVTIMIGEGAGISI